MGKVATWFREKTSTVKAGDVVNFFFQSHGEMNGDMIFSERMMSISDLQQLLHLFYEDIRLNIFASHCFSGSLVQKSASDPLQTKQRFVAAPCTPTKNITLFDARIQAALEI